jgi:hypothetical protein
MIKLETTAAALPQVLALLVIQSASSVPGVALSTETIREEVNGQWVDSVANMRQFVAGYIDGKPFRLSGKVNHLEAVEVPACFKAVVEVEAKMALTTAYEKGDKSKEFCQVSLVRVVEVWETATKCLWRAKDAAGNGHAEPPAQMDPATGRISKVPVVSGRA